MKTTQVCVTQEMINDRSGGGDPRNCMLAKALKAAGFRKVVVDTYTDINNVEDIPLTESLRHVMMSYDIDGYHPLIPFRFNVYSKDDGTPYAFSEVEYAMEFNKIPKDEKNIYDSPR